MKAVKKLDGFRLTEVINTLVENIEIDHDCNREYARYLLANALVRNVVANEVYDMIDYFYEEEEV